MRFSVVIFAKDAKGFSVSLIRHRPTGLLLWDENIASPHLNLVLTTSMGWNLDYPNINQWKKIIIATNKAVEEPMVILIL